MFYIFYVAIRQNFCNKEVFRLIFIANYLFFLQHFCNLRFRQSAERHEQKVHNIKFSNKLDVHYLSIKD